MITLALSYRYDIISISGQQDVDHPRQGISSPMENVMTNQSINISIKGFDETFETNPTDAYPLDIASGVEKGVIFLVKRFIDEKYRYENLGTKTLGFAISDKQLGIIAMHIIEPIMAFSKHLFIKGHASDFTIKFLIPDIACEYHQINIAIAFTQATSEVSAAA